MLRWFRRRLAKRISVALDEHVRFEEEHVRYMTDALDKVKAAGDQSRAVPIGDRSFVRKPGEYDRDQRVERVVGEIIRAYRVNGKRAPKAVRSLVEEALP